MKNPRQIRAQEVGLRSVTRLRGYIQKLAHQGLVYLRTDEILSPKLAEFAQPF